jgi:hypothetical protein
VEVVVVIILMGLALILVVMTLAVLMDSMVEDLTVSRKCAIEGPLPWKAHIRQQYQQQQ